MPVKRNSRGNKKRSARKTGKQSPGGGADAVSTPAQRLKSAHERLAKAETARRAGKFKDAKKICAQLLGEHPDFVAALQTLGITCLMEEEFEAAFGLFAKAVALAPGNVTNHTNFAAAALNLGETQAAVTALEAANRLAPGQVATLFSLGDIHRDEQRMETAKQYFRAALKADPKFAAARLGLANCLMEQGDHEAALNELLRVHEENPGEMVVVKLLADNPAAKLEDCAQAFAKVMSLTKDGSEGDAHFQATVEFTRAAIAHRAGKPETAWRALEAANALEQGLIEGDWTEDKARRDALLEASKSLEFQAGGDGGESSHDDVAGDPAPLIVMAPSRAGKSTLEALAATLDGVTPGYESRAIARAAAITSRNGGVLTLNSLNPMPAALAESYARNFAAELRAIGPDAKFIVNTHPSTVEEAGALARILPRARFVVITRDRIDHALRIFMRQYKSELLYGYSIPVMMDYLNWYDAMCALWENRFPERITRIAYEDMVADPKAARAAVARLCGLDAGAAGPLPAIGDDRGCGVPYREMIEQAASAETT